MGVEVVLVQRLGLPRRGPDGQFISYKFHHRASGKQLLDEQTLIERSQERFGLSRSEALWQVILFIQENAGPEGDLAVIEREDGRYFQFRFVEWPSWLPKFVKKPKWHKEPKVERFSALNY